jgi:ATP-dependent RNA helicase RhlE
VRSLIRFCARLLRKTTLTDFASLGLSEPILRAVAAEGYTTPTPIQAQAIPLICDGHDLVGIAQTGTGKTAAFVLPMLHRLEQIRRDALEAGRKGGPAPRNCHMLILAPTRELATQIGDCIRAYGRHLRPSMAIVLGGVKPGPQIRALTQGQEIVVATPGRLLDHVGGGVLRLDQTTVVVLDEADQMMDLGFMPGIRKIMARLPKDRQTVLLSATMPKQIRSLADDFLNNPREVAVTPESMPVDRIDQKVIMVPADGKRQALVDLLRGEGVERSIVFTRTKRGADKVTAFINAAGLTAEAIHGDKSQSQRERALNAFRNDRVRILVATDIAARGIDVDGISHVFNFELPNVPESYVHRIGRTARAGAAGSAVSLCDHTERGLLRDIERLIGRALAPPQSRDSREPRSFNSGGARPQGQGAGRPQGQGAPRPQGQNVARPQARPVQPRVAGEGRPHEPAVAHGPARSGAAHNANHTGGRGAAHGGGHHGEVRHADARRPEGRSGDARRSAPTGGERAPRRERA